MITESSMNATTEPEFAVEIRSPENERLVSIKCDGSVVVHKQGSEPEAARIFWDAIGIEGRNYAELRKCDGANF
jgi:hypothetical protein